MQATVVHADKPEVLRFQATIIEQNGRAVIAIPRVVSQKLKKASKVEGTLATRPFRAMIDWREDTAAMLRVSVAMLRGVRIGQAVECIILGPEAKPMPPSDLRRAFAASPAATGMWQNLTILGQHDWIRWIEDTKKPETRARRVARTVAQLADGRRRACCTDVNRYMMHCIRQDDMRRKEVV